MTSNGLTEKADAYCHIAAQEFIPCSISGFGIRRTVEIATISGVGSSARGSAALAWNVSSALTAPVLAIVPGYGVADMLLQGMGGWFGFGLYNFLNTKSRIQTALATLAPRTARIGRRLSASMPRSEFLSNGGPVFRTGSGSSDVLHDLMEELPIKCVVGHSKGALSISNALQNLDPGRTKKVQVITLGCPIAENIEGAEFHQFLGWFDFLGLLNAWGNLPNRLVLADHSTNTTIPFSMSARKLVTDS